MRSACAHTCKTSYLFLSHTVERPQKIPIEVHNYHYQLQQQTATDRRDSRCTTTYHYMQHLNTFSSTHCVQSTVVPQVQPLWRRSQENAKATILLFSKSPVRCSAIFQVVERVDGVINQHLQGDDARWHKNHSIHKNSKNTKMNIRFPSMHSRR